VDAARAQHFGSAKHLARPMAEPGQVIEHIGRGEVLAVGVADGQGEPRHPHQGVRRDLGEPPLGGQGECRCPQGVLAAEDAVTDTCLVFIGEVASGPDQSELPGKGWRQDVRIVGELGAGDSEAFQPRCRPAAVWCLAAQRPVQGLGKGQPDAGQDQRQLA
jgi:hypothetical protein